MKIKECKICGYSKTWTGSDIDCCFQNSDTFGENWNCGLISQIRDLCELAMNEKDYRLHYQYCDDQKYVTIRTSDIDDSKFKMGLCLWVSWHKSRGATDAIWILDEYLPPRKPTCDDLQAIVKHYNDLYGTIKLRDRIYNRHTNRSI